MTNDDVSYGGRECEWRVGRAVDGLPVAASRRALGRSWGRSGLGLGRLPLPFCVLRVHLQPYRTLTLYNKRARLLATRPCAHWSHCSGDWPVGASRLRCAGGISGRPRVGDDGLLEIKAPQRLTKPSNAVIVQATIQLACTSRRVCDIWQFAPPITTRRSTGCDSTPTCSARSSITSRSSPPSITSGARERGLADEDAFAPDYGRAELNEVRLALEDTSRIFLVRQESCRLPIVQTCGKSRPRQHMTRQS